MVAGGVVLLEEGEGNFKRELILDPLESGSPLLVKLLPRCCKMADVAVKCTPAEPKGGGWGDEGSRGQGQRGGREGRTVPDTGTEKSARPGLDVRHDYRNLARRACNEPNSGADEDTIKNAGPVKSARPRLGETAPRVQSLEASLYALHLRLPSLGSPVCGSFAKHLPHDDEQEEGVGYQARPHYRGEHLFE